MNRLDPGLKRLIRWARKADEPPSEAPVGFSGRVVSRWSAAPPAPPLPAMLRLVFVVAVASAVVILGGGAYLWTQSPSIKPAADISSAAQFVASNLTP